MSTKVAPCSNCGGKNLYKSKEVSAGGGYAPDQLPGLGGLLSVEKFNIVLCRDCGLMRFFARESATAKLEGSSKWTKLI